MDIVKYDTITNLSDEQRVIPLFTLNSLLMPGEKMFMRVFEPRYKQMLDDVSIDNLPYGHVMANPSMATLNGWSTPYDVGTLVNVERMEEQGTNLLYDAMGGKRFTIISLIEPALPPENFGSIFPSVDELEDNYTPVMSAEPGTFHQLGPGMDFKAFDPSSNANTFADFESRHRLFVERSQYCLRNHWSESMDL